MDNWYTNNENWGVCIFIIYRDLFKVLVLCVGPMDLENYVLTKQMVVRTTHRLYMYLNNVLVFTMLLVQWPCMSDRINVLTCFHSCSTVQCPLCGQFLTLLNKHNDVKKCVKKLEKDLEACKQNKTTSNNSTCEDTKRKCLIDGITYDDNVFVKNKRGLICYCRVRKIDTHILLSLW